MIVLRGAEGRHATTVRRISPGERVDVTDGGGLVAECQVIAARPGELELAVRARRTEPEPACRVVTAQALIKGERGERAIELMTEVGIDEIVPWAAERCVTRWRPDREERALARWRSTAYQASKQSRRARFPIISGQQATDGLLRRVSSSAVAILLDPAAVTPIDQIALPEAGDIMVIVGPEGGVSAGEENILVGAGAIPARLGPLVLRGSTAGAIAGALLLSRCGRWTV